MRLDAFFENFELFADAPNAVEKFRALVVQLAVSGRLVSNREEDVPVGLNLSGVGPPWMRSVPANWRTGVLGEAITLEYGTNLPAGKRADVGLYPVYGSNGIVGTHDSFLIDEPAIIVGRKGSAGALNIANGPSWTTDVAYFVRPPADIDLRFAYYLLASLRLDELGKGIKPGLSRKEAYQLPIALPPLAEQRRIVAKVDELMALCDRLEVQEQERQSSQAALARASLARFADAPAPANLDFLFHDAYAVEPSELRKAVLSLAVQGKLVPQDPLDETGDRLLDRIGKGRNALLQGGYPNRDESMTQLRKQQSQGLPSGLEPVAPGWSWATLMQASLVVVDCHNKTAPYVSSGIRLLRTTNIRHGRLNFSEPRFVDETTYQRWSARIEPAPGDILITREAPMGEVCIIPDGVKVCLGQRMMLIRIVPESMDRKFLLYSLMAPDLMERVQDKPVGATVQHLRVGGVETLLVPIPPLAEQHRIAAKVDQLMALVDQLEAQLAAAKATQTTLLEVAVQELLNPTAEIVPFPSAARGALPDRAAVGCYAIQRLGDKRTFGRTAEVKVLYLAEAHLGLGLGGRYLRDAAGPLDQWIYTFEEEAARQQWFSVLESLTKEGHKKIDYRPGPNLSAKAQEGATRLSTAQRRELDRLLGLLAQKPTVEVEIIATLFAAWNDFLIDGLTPSDDEIVREVRENWHPSKQRFTQAELKTWLAWLRQHALVPQGQGPHTVGQQGKLQLH